jgi:nucleotide-binding universal stress UspA family protein
MTAAIIPVAAPVTVKKILFTTDFSDASRVPLPTVAALARRFNAELVITNVWSELPPPMVVPEAAPIATVNAQDIAEEGMRHVVNADVLSGLRVRTQICEVDPVERIVALADSEEADIIVCGTHGRRGFKHFLLGSVAEGLIRQAHCPVLTVGPHVGKRFCDPHTLKNILVPTDMSQDSKAVLPYVMSLAAEFAAQVHFLHVLPAEIASNPQARELFDPLKKKMERELCGDVTPSCHAEFLVDFGDEAESIAAMARETKCDLIAMGARSGFWAASNIRNSVIYKTIANADCPVLTVRGR